MLLLLGLAARADKMGFTPYGYGVDKPVVVRSTVSYGRGWQMLRSRGEGSAATGPCDPPQDPSDCNCSSANPPTPADSEMPACLARVAASLEEEKRAAMAHKEAKRTSQALHAMKRAKIMSNEIAAAKEGAE